jgi:hypothetical protein
MERNNKDLQQKLIKWKPKNYKESMKQKVGSLKK